MKKLQTRPIKFRVWDKSTNTMLTEEDKKYWKLYLSGRVSIEDTWATNDVTLMQFTGLKDRRGQDIFEGDIVRSIAITNKKRYSYGLPVLVQWKTTPVSNGYNIASGKLREVVGNIFENPELLKKKP